LRTTPTLRDPVEKEMSYGGSEGVVEYLRREFEENPR
jgi:hypothetical protein